MLSEKRKVKHYLRVWNHLIVWTYKTDTHTCRATDITSIPAVTSGREAEYNLVENDRGFLIFTCNSLFL